jgi:hypothetical protein
MMGGRFGVVKPVDGDSVLCPFIVSFRDLLLPGVRQYDQMKTQRNKSVAKLTNKKQIYDIRTCMLLMSHTV